MSDSSRVPQDTAVFPALFISHGSPMFALEPGQAGAALRALGQALPRPRAVLVLSPHWMTRTLQVGAHPQPHTIHDFGGFPDALYALQYPAPGASREMVDELVELLASRNVPVQLEPEGGLDHGVWVPLMHLYPEADVPVLHLSFPSSLTPETAHALGTLLAPLRQQGVFIVGSGSLTHNLRDFFGGSGDTHYVAAFAQWIAETLQHGHTAALLDYRAQAPFAERSHPTDEHLLPLMFAWGAAEGTTAGPAFRLPGEQVGSLQMDSYLFGASEGLRNALAGMAR